MTLACPKALLLLLLLVPFTVLAIWNFQKKKRLLRGYIAAEAEGQAVVRAGREIDFFKSSLLIGVFLLLVLALARPQWGERFESLDIRGLEIVFLLDTSASMNAEDVKPSRLEVGRTLVAAVVDALGTDLVSQVNFAGAAYVQCPPTLDYEAFKLLALSSPISPPEEQGTDFAKALALAAGLFRSSRASRRVMILVTDGEDQEQGWPEALQAIAKRGVTLFTVGVGAPGGAPIPLRDGDGATRGWKKDGGGRIVTSRLDEETLKRIAAGGGGQYYRMSDAAGIAPMVDILRAFERRQLAQKVRRRKIDRFQIPLLLAVALLVMEMALSDRRIAWRKG